MDFTAARADNFIQNNAPRKNPRWRPKFHLAGECGWINDPHGFIHYKDEYHLFYQHYPYEPRRGPMHWRHAVSSNLITWRNGSAQVQTQCLAR